MSTYSIEGWGNMWNGKGTYEEYIEHYGVLGMKWGIRKARTKSSPEPTSFTEGGKRKADSVITEKDKSRAMRKIKTESAKREKEWEKLYLKRSTMGDREIQLALNRLKLENQLAKEVATSVSLTKPEEKKSLLDKHRNKIVVASKITESISGMMDYEVNPNAQVVNKLAKNVGGALAGKKK